LAATSPDPVTVPPPNTSETTLTIITPDRVSYTGSGGKTGKQHVQITLSVVDADGPVSGASASVRIQVTSGNKTTPATGSGVTGADGTVTWTWSNSPSGTYSTTVTSLTKTGAQWDGRQPVNDAFTK
jgi:hypothetical protein